MLKLGSAAARQSMMRVSGVSASLFGAAPMPVFAAPSFAAAPLPMQQPSLFAEFNVALPAVALAPAVSLAPLAINLDGPFLVEEALEAMNRNKRRLKKANHGARPCNSRGRKARRIRRHLYSGK
jgi:hypothetical protein